MGINASKQPQKPQRPLTGGKKQNIQISGPSGGLQMIPTPQRDGAGRPLIHKAFEINREQLLVAFRCMAEYIRQQGASVSSM